MTKKPVYKTRAAFSFDGQSWRWITWSHEHANKHAAIIEKAREINANSWDFSQADHETSDRARW